MCDSGEENTLLSLKSRQGLKRKMVIKLVPDQLFLLLAESHET